MKFLKMKLYEDRSDVTLTAYIADDSHEMLKGRRRPAVLIVPGGAYITCSDREAEPIALRFMGIGYHAFILRYSVFGRGNNVWTEAIKREPVLQKETTYPNPLLEIGMSMLMIREHADEWLVDPEQIGITGFSAGGHNCAMYSTFWHTERVTDPLNIPPMMLRPSFCILGYPFIDFVYHTSLTFDDDTRKAYQLMYLSYLGTTEPTEDQLREVSPNYFVTEKNPPTFIWNTSTDPGVPVRHTLHMACALADHDVPFELHSFGEGAHGLALADLATAGRGEEVNDTVAQWFPLAATWLKKYVVFPVDEG